MAPLLESIASSEVRLRLLLHVLLPSFAITHFVSKEMEVMRTSGFAVC